MLEEITICFCIISIRGEKTMIGQKKGSFYPSKSEGRQFLLEKTNIFKFDSKSNDKEIVPPMKLFFRQRDNAHVKTN